jgi:hypothetical protein
VDDEKVAYFYFVDYNSAFGDLWGESEADEAVVG